MNDKTEIQALQERAYRAEAECVRLRGVLHQVLDLLESDPEQGSKIADKEAKEIASLAIRFLEGLLADLRKRRSLYSLPRREQK